MAYVNATVGSNTAKVTSVTDGTNTLATLAAVVENDSNLTVTANGTYNATQDGYKKVVVNVEASSESASLPGGAFTVELTTATTIDMSTLAPNGFTATKIVDGSEGTENTIGAHFSIYATSGIYATVYTKTGTSVSHANYCPNWNAETKVLTIPSGMLGTYVNCKGTWLIVPFV